MNLIYRLPIFVRWILLPFASFFTVLLVNAFGKLAAKIFVFLSTPGGLSENFFEFLFLPGVSGFCGVYIAMAFAPKKKSFVGYTVAFLWIALAGALAVFNIMLREWPSVLQSASLIGGCILAIYNPLPEETSQK
ncbi:hypothetical protein KZZ10_11125 [Alcaligenaceae bacterium LF4-65]|uniref:Uncharacterized protein n=1 Tax=Zwartia hollandica TaxID=324606 RepID=A0A953T7Z0_9BURK|nr:hypothetical protein [Zwartia hollandica]MBZ1351199.1 hypothetical protein [Zwartia hollandica]